MGEIHWTEIDIGNGKKVFHGERPDGRKMSVRTPADFDAALARLIARPSESDLDGLSWTANIEPFRAGPQVMLCGSIGTAGICEFFPLIDHADAMRWMVDAAKRSIIFQFATNPPQSAAPRCAA